MTGIVKATEQGNGSVVASTAKLTTSKAKRKKIKAAADAQEGAMVLQAYEAGLYDETGQLAAQAYLDGVVTTMQAGIEGGLEALTKAIGEGALSGNTDWSSVDKAIESIEVPTSHPWGFF